MTRDGTVLPFPSRFRSAALWAKVSEHWLAVEVLSRSSRVYDREFKRDAYLALGVAEVWGSSTSSTGASRSRGLHAPPRPFER